MGEAKSLLKSADNLFDTGDFDKAVSNYKKVIAGSHNPKYLAAAYNGLGHTLRSKKELKKALAFQKKSLLLYRSLSKRDKSIEPQLCFSLHYMSDIFADMKKPQRAMLYFREELKIGKRLYSKDRKYLSQYIHGLYGVAFRLSDTGNYDGAITNFRKALKLLKNNEKNQPNISLMYHGIGLTYLRSGDMRRAKSNLETSLRIRKKLAKKNKRFITALNNTKNALAGIKP